MWRPGEKNKWEAKNCLAESINLLVIEYSEHSGLIFYDGLIFSAGLIDQYVIRDQMVWYPSSVLNYNGKMQWLLCTWIIFYY